MDEKEKYTYQLLIDFHDRFTASSDDHQSIFVAFLSAVFGAFAGFGYVVYKIVGEAKCLNPILLTISGCVAILIFSFLNFIQIYQNAFFYKTLKIINKIREDFLTPFLKKQIFEEYGTKKGPRDFYMIGLIFMTLFKFIIFFVIYFLQKNSLLEIRTVFALLAATICAEGGYYLKKQRKF